MLIAALALQTAACGGSDEAAVPDAMPEMGFAQLPSAGGVEELGEDAVRLTAPLVTGQTLVTTLRVQKNAGAPPPSGGDPTPLRGFKVSHTQTGDGGLEFRLEYWVPAVSAPPDLWAVRPPPGADPGHAWRWSPLGTAWAQGASAPDGFKVIMESVLSNLTSEMLAGIEKGTGILMNEFLLKDAQVKDSMFSEGHVTQLASSVNDVMSAMKIQEHYQGLQRRLARARQCAENPTNPLTRKAYQEDPALRGRNLGELDAASADVTGNTAVRFVGAINAQIASLSQIKWLGWVTGPATGWADANLEALSDRRVAEIERLVPGCDPRHGGWTGTITWEETETIKEGGRYQPPDSGERGNETTSTTFLAVNVSPGSQADSLGLATAKTELRHTYQQTGFSNYVSGSSPCDRRQGQMQESATGSGTGTARVTFAEYPDGRYHIRVAEVEPIVAKGKHESSNFLGCSGRTETQAYPLEKEAGVPGFDIEGQREPGNMDVIAGWETRTTTVGKVTIRWSLERGAAEKPAISAAP